MSFLGTQMSDTSTIWRDFTRGDWVMNGAQLQSGGDLTTAVLISLFTDRQARSDDVIPDGTTDQRGWWADSELTRRRERARGEPGTVARREAGRQAGGRARARARQSA